MIDPCDLIGPQNYGTRGVPHDAWTRLREESKHADILDISSQPHLLSNREGPMLLSGAQQIQTARRARLDFDGVEAGRRAQSSDLLFGDASYPRELVARRIGI